MSNKLPSDGRTDPDQIDRDELERDLLEWFKTQNYSPEEVNQVLHKMRRFDARTLQESFFASVGTGSIEFNEMIDSILSEHTDKPAELEFLIDNWSQIPLETRRAIYLLAKGTLPPSTQQAIIALIQSLPGE